MKLVKDNILLLFPEGNFLCAGSNEGNTEGDIGEMGKRLAREVRLELKEIL